MICNKATNGFLVFDLGEKIASVEEAFGCTTTDKEIGPCARSVIVIKRYDQNDGSVDNIVRYGQKVQLQANPYIYAKPLFLHSMQVTPNSYARFSRH